MFKVKNYELLNQEVYLICGDYTVKAAEPYLVALSQNKIIAGTVRNLKDLKDCVVQIDIQSIDSGFETINLEFDSIAIKNDFIGNLRNKLYQFKEAKYKAQKNAI